MDRAHSTTPEKGGPMSMPPEEAPRAVLEQAKNIDETPDITSDEYWDEHHIAVVRATDVIPLEPNRPGIRHRVQTPISEAPMESERDAPLRHWRLATPAADRPVITPGDEYVVFYRREGPSPIMALPRDAALVNRLQRIASLRRGDGGVAALSEGVVDRDRDVALYALKRLRKQPQLDLDQAFVTRLRGVRDANDVDPEVRIVAADVLGGVARVDDAEGQYKWLQGAPSSAQGYDWTALRKFALRMLEFPDKQRETAEFLTALVKDAAQSQDVRIAAYSVFEDPRLVSDRNAANLIFQTLEWMLRSPDDFLHKPAAMLLHNLTQQADPDVHAVYQKRARAALQSALDRGLDPGTEQTIRRSLDLLSARTDR
jgi:hypothetical protein